MAGRDPVKEFIERIDRLEKRFKGDKYADRWLVPKEILIAVRDELKAPMLPNIAADAIPGPASGNSTCQKACQRVQPSI